MGLRARSSASPPGPRWPVAAQTLAWFARPDRFLTHCNARYGDLFAIDLAYVGRWVMLVDPDDIREVFSGEQSRFHAGRANRVLEPVVGAQSMLVLDGSPHLARRKLLASALAPRINGYEPRIRELAEREISTWPSGSPLPLLPKLRAIALEVILEVVLGASAGPRAADLRLSLRELLDWVTSTRALAALLALGPRVTLARTPLAGLLERFETAIAEQIAQARSDPRLAERDDLLATLALARYEDGEPLSAGDLRDQLITVLVAGHESTATSLAWALESLVRAPAALERARMELDVGEHVYLDAVCKETLRLRPPLPIAGRLVREPLQLSRCAVPAGTWVAPCIYLVHRRAEIYPEPDRFQPERFLGRQPPPHTWIPFGGGSRRCIGAGFALSEMRAVLSAILARAYLRPARRRPERTRRRALVLAPSRDAEVLLEHAR
jgi:cytochrome P450